VNKTIPQYVAPGCGHSVATMHSSLRSRAALVGAFAFFAVALVGCGSTPATDTGSGGDTGSDTGTGTDTEQSSGDLVTLSGDGSYLIPDEMPYGDYQLVGEPASQPDGCTWSIQDADGGVVAENTGIYVFITDVDEASTFTTDGCPDWEQYG
jgi:hypothetical protein